MSASLPTSTEENDAVSLATGDGSDNNEHCTVSNLVRESADGGSTGSLTQTVNVDDDGKPGDGNPSEKEKENATEDLDKDIDVMIETNTENGFINPDSSITLSSLQVDLTGDSALDMSNIQTDQGDNNDLVTDVNGNLNSEKVIEKEAGAQIEVSEKSFASSTDSSVVAEVVVKKAIDKAVKEFDTNVNQNSVKNEYDTEIEHQEVNQVKTEVKVGLFQYGGFDDDIVDSEEDENNDKDDYQDADTTQKQVENDSFKAKDLKVGLFQYFGESGETAEVNSPEVFELDDDNGEDDYVNEEENRGDMLKLYGLDLEGLDQPVSPKSASPPESGPPSMESIGANKVIDVQRDIYEPQTRLFSVTKSSSSTDSTPRNDSTKEIIKNATETTDNNTVDETTEQHESNKNESENDDDDFTPRGSVKSVTREDLDVSIDDRILCGTGPGIPVDISPPLIRYEPLTDNGKFRIVKTVKEGGEKSYSTIRVGISPSQSPRETGSQGQGSTGSENGLTPNQSPRLPQDDMQEDGKIKTILPESLPVEVSNEEQQQIDKELIRELIEKEKKSDLIPTRDSGASTQPYVVQPNQMSARPLIKSNEGSKSPKQMSLSELRDSPREQEKGVKFSPREATLGGEIESDVAAQQSRDDYHGRQLREQERSQDSQSFERRYQSMLERDSYFSRSYDRDRYSSEEPSRELSDASNRYSSSYQDTHHDSTTQRSLEPASHQPIKPIDSSVIPGFKTLQEQQAKWSTMFSDLESEHRHELRSQYDKHQSNIKRLQQQMEHELQKQHVAIRKKLDLHKEALSKMSPDRGRLSPERRHRSLDRSSSRGGRDRSHERAMERPEATDTSDLQNSQNSKSWREIYQEVRAEESDMDQEPSPRLQRALDSEFASVDTTIDRSRSSISRPLPLGRSKEKNVSNADSTRSFRDSFPSSYEEKITRSSERESRTSERESRSKVKARNDSPVHKMEEDRLTSSTGSGRTRHDDVSPHVQELLDNLKDSHRSLRGLQDDIVTKATTSSAKTSDHSQELVVDRPRAGVFSSPMPGFRGKESKPVEKQSDEPPTSMPSMRSSRRSIEDQFYLEQQVERRRSTDHRETAERDNSRDSFHIEDILSSSERVNLREKHSKHLTDLRAYYEEELRELRKALSDSMEMTVPSADTSMQSTIHNQLLEAENKHLLDKCKTMEDDLEELYAKIRHTEQKNHGLEKRASEYAAAFGDSQAMAVQHRAHIEELQRYCRERDDLVNDLESKVRSQDDGVKLYKKSFDEEMELHRHDKIALQRITDKYESLDREYKLLQETMTVTENKLYEARTEIVELNRAMAKLELENKRLGRENDNLRHKVTQSLNLSTMHDSFGSPSPQRGYHTVPTSKVIRPRSPVNDQIATESRVKSTDERVPGFTGAAASSWNSVDKSAKAAGKARTDGGKRSDSIVAEKKEKRETKPLSRKDALEIQGRRGTGQRSSAEESQREAEWYERSRISQNEEQIPVRDRTPPRSSSVASQAESEISDYSPLLKAERELFKLRDMMRHAVAIKPSNSPPAPKLQKKFYGSERPTNKDDYAPDLGANRGRKEQPNNHTGVAKTKSTSTNSKSDRTAERRPTSKRSSSSRSDRSSTKSKDRSDERERDRREISNSEDRTNNLTPPRRKPTTSVNPDIYDSPTRFDVNVNDDRKMGKLSQKKGDIHSTKQRNLFDSDGDSRPVREEPAGATSAKRERNVQENADKVTNTLDMMRNGQFTTRPQWEDVFTSMVKPKPEHQEKIKSMTTEEKIQERMRSISEMETRYDGLHAEKRQLESSINKIPLHGRVDRNGRRQKEQLEERLDSVEKEIGSLKMTLKRYNVLKTAG